MKSVFNTDPPNFSVDEAKNIVYDYHNIKTDLNNKLDSDFLNKIKNRKIWCAASTHPTEEMLCAMSHVKIKENYNSILETILLFVIKFGLGR